MKRYLLYILCVIAFASCVTPKKLIQNDRYDDAVTALVRKLKKKPKKQKNILRIQYAYRKANEVDNGRLEFLRKEGRPENWEEIFAIYEKIRRRQNRVKGLPRLVDQKTRSVIYFDYVNVDQEMIHAKQKAAEFVYAKAVRDLDAGGRANARIAYNGFKRVKEYYKDYKDTDALMEKARRAGISHVLFSIQNQSRVLLPPDFEKELKKSTMSDASWMWVDIDVNAVRGRTYDFNVVLNITHIDVLPERVKESRYTETREIEDGWVYLKDKKGNVKKDSLGNDIKVPKIVRIQCDVIETIQLKDATMRGQLEIVNNASGELVKRLPVGADSHFEHVSLAAFGDLNALSKEQRRMLGNPVPFPDDFGMLMMCADILKDNTKKQVSDNYLWMD